MLMSENSQRPIIPPYIAISFAILALSTASIVIRFAQEDAPSLVIAAYRLSIAVLILTPVVIRNHLPEIRKLSRKALLLALLSGFFLAVHFAVWITSLEYTSVASSVVLVSTIPLWVALIAPLAINERLTKPILIGMVITLVGGLIVGLGDTCTVSGLQLTCPSFVNFFTGRAFLGDILAIIGALTAAFYILIGRSLRKDLSLVSYVFLVYGMAAVILILATFIFGESLIGYAPKTYLWFVLLAIFPQLLGHSTYNWALKYLSAAYVSIALLGEPIGTIILAYFFLKEAPTTLKMIGAILILTGIFIASQKEKTLIEPPG